MPESKASTSAPAPAATEASGAEVKRSIVYVAKDANRDAATISKMRLPFGEAMGAITPFFDIKIMEGRRVSGKYTDLLPNEMRKILGTHTGDAVMVEALARLEASSDPAVEGRLPLAKENELRMAIGGASTNEHVVPSAALRAFVQKGSEFYYANAPARLAFVDGGTSLRTRENSAAVAAALVSISVARGWDSITVAGSEDFRRMVWTEAARQGLEVLGFSPTPEDAKKAGLESKADRGEAPHVDTEDRAARIGESPAAAGAARANHDRYAGELLRHGTAHYRNDPAEGMSYFVELQTDRGAVTHWGKGIEAAIAATGAQEGDTIRLQKTGSRPIDAPVTVRDESGEVTGQQWTTTQRNEWTATVLDASRAPAPAAGLAAQEHAEPTQRARAAHAIRQDDAAAQDLFPELTRGAASVINSVQQTIQRDLKDTQPLAAAKVVQATRRILADQVEQGKPVELGAEAQHVNEKRQRRQQTARR